MKGEYESSKTEPTLAAFQSEMSAFAAKEMSGEAESGHFLASGTSSHELNPNFDVSKLTEEDLRIWEAIKDKTIDMGEFHRYAYGVSGLDKTDPARLSRMVFSDFAGNMASRVIFEREEGK